MDSFIKTLCTCLFIFVMTVTVPPVIEFIKTVSEKNGDMGTASYYPITETEFGYSLSYNLDGGTVDNPTYYSLYSPTFTLNNPTKTGYEFVGWTGSNGDTPQLTVTICTGSAGDLEFTANYKMNYFIELSDNVLEWYIGEDVNDYEFYVNGAYLEHIKGIYSLDITSLNEYFNPGPNTLMVKFGTHMVSTSYMYFPSESFDNLTLDCHFSLRSDGYRISCVDNDITMIELGYSFDGNCNYSYFNGGIRYPNNQNEDYEESYIENILRLNKGKVGTFYMTYNDSLEYRDKVYRGIIQAAGKDHIVISDTRDGKRYILLLVYLDYVEFDEPINYEYPIR